MPVDYNAISAENRVKYGTDIRRIGGMLLADRYDDRTHFIFELLQNAEDALAKRGTSWNGSRTVTFSLCSDDLIISHFGKPFDVDDVRGVCGIGESTKGLTDIGRFGIGFKSVYAFTDNPEIHSSGEHFAVVDYVHPKQVRKRYLEPEETVVRIPFRKSEPDAKDKILNGLRNLNARTLLFLRQIEELHWEDTDDGISGLYMRGRREPTGDNVRKVMLIGQDDENGDVEEDYIVFSKEVSKENTSVGHVEIAFALEADDEDEQPRIQPATDTELVAFFPTVLSTNLGFVMQGPYRTTPSRDNVPESDEWNRLLVEETSRLLIDALKELRGVGLLNVSSIECLPLDNSLSRFTPLFNAVRDALRTEKLLPAYSGGYIAGQNAMLARGRGLRDFISPAQLTQLYESGEDILWLSAEITENRTSQLYQYLTDTLDVGEVTPADLIRRLDQPFLEEQPDEWIERLYSFLNEQRSLRLWMSDVPLVRLDDGSHVVAQVGDEPQAYLPSESKTDFPTVRAGVCQSDDALEFLKYLGLREPDPVDDVIANVLPRYQDDNVDVADDVYQSDIARILNAYRTDSREQRDRLVSTLQSTRFIAAVDMGNGSTQFVRPYEVYQATETLKDLFEDVNGVFLVDDSKDELYGRRIGDVIQASGASNVLERRQTETSLSDEARAELRRNSGDERKTSERPVEDYNLMGLDNLLALLPELPDYEASEKAELLWNALHALERSRSINHFKGSYRWFYHHTKEATFQSRFVRKLNERAWVPDKNGTLQPPGAVTFSDTGWVENPNLRSEIQFMPDAVTELAEAMGIDPEAVSFLQQNGITLEQLKERFTELEEEADALSDESDCADADKANGADLGNQSDENEANSHDKEKGATQNGQTETEDGVATTDDKQGPAAQATKEFISYVALSHDDDGEDPDGLAHQERMSLESQAIDLILSEEPSLCRTPPNNPGFDLFEEDSQNAQVRWVEVKSMKGSLENRPATLTRTQFEFAQQKQDAYWLYVVENAGDPATARIVRINNPAGRANTFTFDRGWKEAAEVSDQQV